MAKEVIESTSNERGTSVEMYREKQTRKGVMNDERSKYS